MPIVNKHPIKASREIPCKICGNYLDYVYSETMYVCTVCGRQFDPRDVIGDIGDMNNINNKAILKAKYNKPVKTRRERVKDDFGDLLEEMQSVDPDELMERIDEEQAQDES